MANIIPRETNDGDSYEVRFRDQGGKQHSKTFKTERDAKKFKKIIESEVTRSVFKDERGNVLFKKYAEDWFNGTFSSRVKPSTLYRTRSIAMELIGYFGSYKVNQIDRLSIKNYLDQLKGISNRTKNYRLVILRQILNEAMDDFNLENNPAQSIKKFKEVPMKKEILTVDEVRTLIETAQNPLKTIIAVAIHTGMRIGEIRALKWKDINLTERTISVQRNLFKYQEGSPKGGVDRVAIINDVLYDIIIKYTFELLIISPNNYVFPQEDGRALPDDHVRNTMLPSLLRQLDIPKKITFHCFRHTFCSLSNTINTASLTQQLVGHADIRTTQGYTHRVDEALFIASNAVGKMIQGER